MSQEPSHDRGRKVDHGVNGQGEPPHLTRATTNRNGAGIAPDCQGPIDDAIRRQFEPPTGDAVLARVLAAASAADSGGTSLRIAPLRRRALPWAIAAAVGLVVMAGSWRLVRPAISPPDRGSVPSSILSGTLEQVYGQAVASGFRPAWKCKTDKQFAMTTYSRFGTGLLLAEHEPALQPMGWSYCDSISRHTAMLLLSVNGRNVIVYIDRAEHDPGQKLPSDPRLKLFRKEIGPLVLYELSPLDRANVLDLFYRKEIPKDWLSGWTYEN